METKKSQYFKRMYPKEEFVSFIARIADIDRSWYVLDQACYRKAVNNEMVSTFLSMIMNCYFESKKHFVVKAATNYKSFLTCIRQQCKLHQIQYENHFQYHKSEYQIVYFIHILPSPHSSLISETKEEERKQEPEEEK